MGVQIDRANRTGTGQLWIDGVLSASLPVGTDTRPANGWSRLKAGIEAVNTDAVQVFMDELVLDTTRIGCN
jgi:hypothetical protein